MICHICSCPLCLLPRQTWGNPVALCCFYEAFASPHPAVQRRCGAASAPQQRCPWRCGSSRTLIVLWQCRSRWELGEGYRWSKNRTARKKIIPTSKDYTSCRVFGFGSFVLFFSKVCCQKLDNGLGRSMKATKTRVEARVCKQNYTRGIQQHIYPIVLIEFESWGWGGKSVVDCCFILHNLSPMTKV